MGDQLRTSSGLVLMTERVIPSPNSRQCKIKHSINWITIPLLFRDILFRYCLCAPVHATTCAIPLIGENATPLKLAPKTSRSQVSYKSNLLRRWTIERPLKEES
jgi:hypothetical protein